MLPSYYQDSWTCTCFTFCSLPVFDLLSTTWNSLETMMPLVSLEESPWVSKTCSLTLLTIDSSLSANDKGPRGFELAAADRWLEDGLSPPPPMVRKPVGYLDVVRVDDRTLLPKKGRSQDLTRGNSMGRLVVTTETKASRVPHSPASCAPLIGS